MSHALQVTFRGLLPSEPWVALAAERYRHIRRVRPEALECWVAVESVQGGSGALVQAVVALRGEQGILAEATAVHRRGQVALSLALSQVQARLGVSPDLGGQCWAWLDADPARRAPLRADRSNGKRTRGRAGLARTGARPLP